MSYQQHKQNIEDIASTTVMICQSGDTHGFFKLSLINFSKLSMAAQLQQYLI